MKKILSIFILTSLFTSVAWTQQLPQYSQYVLNRYVINPASAGSENYFSGQTNYRSQWEGVNDAPRTYILSVNGPIANQKMGIGGYMFVDITGPTKRNGFNLSYSYHVKLNDYLKLSMAINAGLLQYTVDGTEIVFEDPTDDLITNSQERNLYPDAGFSFYLYGSNYYFGASAPQLIRNQLDFENSLRDPTGRLVNHYFITGGYIYELNSDFDIEPSFLLKYVKPTPLQYEFTARGIYKDMAWLGVSYRKSDAINLLLGVTLQQNLSVGYSYDITQSDLSNYSSGTHEIMLSVKFNNNAGRGSKSE
jgi:type IX secretion system PorP/SprF family membrane protein